MRISMKFLLILVLAIGFSVAQGSAEGLKNNHQSQFQATLISPQATAASVRIISVEGLRKYTGSEPQHGTHLCSQDSHCGTGHKCCSGHCKAVVTC